MKIRTNDKVIVISWKKKDKWKTGKVLKVFKDTNKILIEKINIVTRHLKKTWSNPWQIVKMEKPIDVSNVALVCPFTTKPTKIGFVVIEDKKGKKKFRFSKKALKEKGGIPKDYILK